MTYADSEGTRLWNTDFMYGFHDWADRYVVMHTSHKHTHLCSYRLLSNHTYIDTCNQYVHGYLSQRPPASNTRHDKDAHFMHVKLMPSCPHSTDITHRHLEPIVTNSMPTT